MAIGMIEFQGSIPRTQDFSVMKHNEDMKSNLDQSNLQMQTEKTTEQKANQVQQSSDSSKSDTHADAREKGKNTYAGDGGKNRKKEQMPADGKVVLKGSTHFDMSV